MSPTTKGERRRTGQASPRPAPTTNTKQGTNACTPDHLDAATTSPASINPAPIADRMRRIIAARTAVEQSNAELRAAVRAAREAGDTWAIIAATLDTARTTIHPVPRQPDSPPTSQTTS
jgi:hypothetical protein